jgi:hypothetical protein
MNTMRALRIFVSSPEDVSEERALAERVLRRLGEEYNEAVGLDVVMWEHEPLSLMRDSRSSCRDLRCATWSSAYSGRGWARACLRVRWPATLP